MKSYKIHYLIIEDLPQGIIEIDAETEDKAKEAFNEIVEDDSAQLLLDAEVRDPNYLGVEIDEIREVK